MNGGRREDVCRFFWGVSRLSLLWLSFLVLLHSVAYIKIPFDSIHPFGRSLESKYLQFVCNPPNAPQMHTEMLWAEYRWENVSFTRTLLHRRPQLTSKWTSVAVFMVTWQQMFLLCWDFLSLVSVNEVWGTYSRWRWRKTLGSHISHVVMVLKFDLELDLVRSILESRCFMEGLERFDRFHTHTEMINTVFWLVMFVKSSITSNSAHSDWRRDPNHI